jgi:hypothetical protein
VLCVPTAYQYRIIAGQLEHVRGSVLSLLHPIVVASSASTFDGAGGRLEQTVNTTIAVTASNVVEIATELQHQVDEALRRASVCERYATAVREFRRLGDLSQQFPRRPASWADHGW